jgi:hypothetical protein
MNVASNAERARSALFRLCARQAIDHDPRVPDLDSVRRHRRAWLLSM